MPCFPLSRRALPHSIRKTPVWREDFPTVWPTLKRSHFHHSWEIRRVCEEIGRGDYYWRPFDGNIPEDAFIAIDDGDLTRTYVGNVPIWGGGIYVGPLYDGFKQIIVTGDSDTTDGVVHKRTNLIQILCTRSPEMFEWIPVNSTTLHDVPYELVEGGYEHKILGVLNVGRVDYEGYYYVGKISGYHNSEKDVIYIVDGDKEVGFSTYEVLAYKGATSK